MKKFVVLIEGLGEGCDYTRGCNRSWHFVKANNLQHLGDRIWQSGENENENEFNIGWGEHSENIPEKITMIEIGEGHLEFPVSTWLEAKKTGDRKKEKQIKEDGERKEWERLNKKFG